MPAGTCCGAVADNGHTVSASPLPTWVRLGLPGLLVLLTLLTLAELSVGPGSLSEVRGLQTSVSEMRAVNQALQRQNEVLGAQILSLTSGMDAVEEQAREELGMIRRGEPFYLVPDTPFDPLAGHPLGVPRRVPDGSAPAAAQDTD